jgi:replicative DNA helicase
MMSHESDPIPDDAVGPAELADDDFPIPTGKSGELGSLQYDRTLPHSLEAERALLAAILQDNSVLGDVLVLRMGERRRFFRDAHQRIFIAMRRLWRRQTKIDLTTLIVELERDGELDEVGGPAYIQLLHEHPHAGAASDYARIIIDRSCLRQLIFLLNKGMGEAYDASHPARAVYFRVMTKLWHHGNEYLFEGKEQP